MPTAGSHFVIDPTSGAPLPAALRAHRATTFGIVDRREGDLVYFTLRSIRPSAVTGALVRKKPEAGEVEVVGLMHGKIARSGFGTWFVLGRNLPRDVTAWVPFRRIDPLVLQGVRQESLGLPYWSHSGASLYRDFPAEAEFIAL